MQKRSCHTMYWWWAGYCFDFGNVNIFTLYINKKRVLLALSFYFIIGSDYYSGGIMGCWGGAPAKNLPVPAVSGRNERRSSRSFQRVSGEPLTLPVAGINNGETPQRRRRRSFFSGKCEDLNLRL